MQEPPPGQRGVDSGLDLLLSLSFRAGLFGCCCRAAGDRRVSHHVIGKTLDGRDIDLLELFGDSGAASSGKQESSSKKKKVWVVARQHPGELPCPRHASCAVVRSRAAPLCPGRGTAGESMAEWLVEGMVQRLLDPADPISRRLSELATVYIIPNINPDGSIRGHLRTNAAGANLNREWAAPSLARSPEASSTGLPAPVHGCIRSRTAEASNAHGPLPIGRPNSALET